MANIVACVDGSAYAQAVCDFAALFADRADLDVVVVSVDEGPWTKDVAPAAVRDASDRLHDHGFERFSARVLTGPFMPTLEEAAEDAALVVMGKRGIDRSPTLSHLGSHVEPVLRTLSQPTCLVSQLYLPVARVVAVLDSDPDHRRAMEFATTNPFLQGFELELVVMDDGRHPADIKLGAARDRLEEGQGAAFSLQAENPNSAVGNYAAGMDLMVLSREMLFGKAGADLMPGNEDSFWRRRTPILVC